MVTKSAACSSVSPDMSSTMRVITGLLEVAGGGVGAAFDSTAAADMQRNGAARGVKLVRASLSILNLVLREERTEMRVTDARVREERMSTGSVNRRV
jgi:hypothetical protein